MDTKKSGMTPRDQVGFMVSPWVLNEIIERYGSHFNENTGGELRYALSGCGGVMWRVGYEKVVVGVQLPELGFSGGSVYSPIEVGVGNVVVIRFEEPGIPVQQWSGKVTFQEQMKPGRYHLKVQFVK